MKNKIEKKFIASMQSIALDSINKAGQGHIGMALGAAPITFELIAKNMKFSATDPKWIDRDRFVLSAGHGSMSMYSVMHFLGLLSKEDMKNHKKIHSKTPSHPEIENTDFVDASTGPLGQGVAMGVGMALSQKYLQANFNKKDYEIVNHDVYVLHGDGCVQEGVALEAIQLAGTLNLNKLVLIHDYNDIQIDSRSNEVNGINLLEYFKAQHFNVFVADVNDHASIVKALLDAKNSDKPSYVQIKTIIAPHTHVADKSSGHNGILNVENTIKFKEEVGLKNTVPFDYDSDVYDYGQELLAKKEEVYEKWMNLYAAYKNAYPSEAKLFEQITSQDFKYDLTGVEFKETNVATRNYIGTIMQYIDANYPNIVGGSADLYAATKVGFSKQLVAQGGKNIKYGIREFAMSAINNGIYLDSNLRTIDSTFLAFSDYMKPAMRLGALMNIPGIHVFTHDSYQVGGDGPTHQPFDQIPMLRAMSNMEVIRPCDESEMLAAFQYALDNRKNQIAIIGCRQPLKSFNLLPTKAKLLNAYVVKNEIKYDLSILASGSEVELALKVAKELESLKIKAQVISVPHLQNLINDENLALSLGLDKKPIFAIEATSDSMWFRLSKYNKFDAFLSSGYGWSEDGQKVYELKGFNVDNLVTRVKKLLKK
ncbi:transketolase-like TK C-terminal-containing protein [Mycoplasmopsis alligatoris]|uniref:transketolase n=1 Tax=Mycoplasmopsis alligatoris A21JP2 TaxID=747682 RepID=D4XVT7_9BACT|nr:transketolase [Mycoplasmopsis alligatoris]EFF41525.1 putative transketolase [Mycoplasmopsis alligatoris A21JP2]